MIPGLLIEAVFELLTFFLSLLPATDLDLPDTGEFGDTVGAIIGPWDAVLPIAEWAAVIVFSLTVVIPAVLLYRIILWVWARIPVIGGGG